MGVNSFVSSDEEPIPTLRVDPALEGKQVGRLQAVRARRDGAAVESSLAELTQAAAQEGRNLMDPLLECARAHASEGEIVDWVLSMAPVPPGDFLDVRAAASGHLSGYRNPT